ncbi:hypothetical protein ATY41_00580 [Leifsonia xyli subsp. xyli]|uniref:Uncharacterized protein n=1 Tax=Leifsonia xyli subsp. xyli TaxID=59736 RepID=A0A1E2SN24_LEIXY|nr:hypothetical protein [Leifsonia xyli]ODA91232.1 hypothetical protein ATY41_00580 [Leifsonia xyli subsp. xyli]
MNLIADTQARLAETTANEPLEPETLSAFARRPGETTCAAIFVAATVELVIPAAVEVAAADIAVTAAATALAV